MAFYYTRAENVALSAIAEVQSLTSLRDALNQFDALVKARRNWHGESFGYIDLGVNVDRLVVWGDNPLVTYSPDTGFTGTTDFTIVKSWDEDSDTLLTRVDPAASNPWRVEPAANYR